jgi:cytochrome c oxidase subunit 1
VHFWLTFIFFNAVFFPMHGLGAQGHMRRIYDPTQYEFLRELQPVNRMITISAFLLFAAQIIFLVNFIVGWFKGAKAGPNPWEDNGLEWATPSPPPHGNFPVTPHVYRGPYEFSSPLATDGDYLPQSRKLATDREPVTQEVAVRSQGPGGVRL